MAVQWLLREKPAPAGRAAAWKGTGSDGKVDFSLKLDGAVYFWRIEPEATLFEVLNREVVLESKRVLIHGSWIDPRLTRAIIWNGCVVSSGRAGNGADEAG